MRVFQEVGAKYPQGLLTVLEGLSVDDPARLDQEIEAFKNEHGYQSHDIVEITEGTPNEALRKFDPPHTHSEDEIRLFLHGSGIFDLLADDGIWYRFLFEKGDMVVVPAGRVHRFEPTYEKTVRCVRIFQDDEGWVPHYVDQAAHEGP